MSERPIFPKSHEIYKCFTKTSLMSLRKKTKRSLMSLRMMMIIRIFTDGGLNRGARTRWWRWQHAAGRRSSKIPDSSRESFLSFLVVFVNKFETGKLPSFCCIFGVTKVVFAIENIKHRKNCKCCTGHYLIVNHYSSMSWLKFRNLSVFVNCP